MLADGDQGGVSPGAGAEHDAALVELARGGLEQARSMPHSTRSTRKWTTAVRSGVGSRAPKPQNREEVETGRLQLGERYRDPAKDEW